MHAEFKANYGTLLNLNFLLLKSPKTHTQTYTRESLIRPRKQILRR